MNDKRRNRRRRKKKKVKQTVDTWEIMLVC